MLLTNRRLWLSVMLIVIQCGFLGAATQQPVTVEGDFTEPLSRLVFPTRTAGWNRARVLKYPEPLGHSVTYELVERGAAVASATAFIYPTVPPLPSSLEEHFGVTLKELRAMKAGAELVSQNATPFQVGGQTIERRLATVLFRNGLGQYREPVVAFLTVSKLPAYWLKWRIDVVASASPQVIEGVQALTEGFVPKL